MKKSFVQILEFLRHGSLKWGVERVSCVIKGQSGDLGPQLQLPTANCPLQPLRSYNCHSPIKLMEATSSGRGANS